MRLGGWHRIGIVLSVISWLGVASWQRMIHLEAAKRLDNLAYNDRAICLSNAQVIASHSARVDASRNCDEQWTRSITENIQIKAHHIPDLVYLPLFLIALGWLLSYIFILTFRWIRRGFGKP